MNLGKRAALLERGDLCPWGVVSHVSSYESAEVVNGPQCFTNVFIAGRKQPYTVNCDTRYGADGREISVKRVKLQRQFTERKINLVEVTVPLDMNMLDLPEDFEPGEYIDADFDEVMIGLVNDGDWELA